MKIEVEIDNKKFLKSLQNTLITDELNLKFHQEFDRMMSPYVPWRDGFLDDKQKIVTPNYIEYQAPYAIRQYYLHSMSDDLAGVTNRTRTVHTRPTSFWDKAFIMEQESNFIAHLQKILDAHIKDMNNGNS